MLFDDSACAIFTPARELSLTRSSQSLDQQLAKVTRRQEQLEAQRLGLIAMKKKADRKLDARRKIIVGAAVLAHAELHPAFADRLRELLDLAVTRSVDREVIADLLPATAPVAKAA
jgi:hypothetical protein